MNRNTTELLLLSTLTAFTFISTGTLHLMRYDMIPEDPEKRKERERMGMKRGQIRLTGDMNLTKKPRGGVG